jgi:hypothetical protein
MLFALNGLQLCLLVADGRLTVIVADQTSDNLVCASSEF